MAKLCALGLLIATSITGCATRAARHETTPRAKVTGVAPATPTRYGSLRAPWTLSPDDAAFEREIQARLGHAATRVRQAVARGQTSPRALAEFARERAYVEDLLPRYLVDGRLTRDERVHLATSVDQIRDPTQPARRATTSYAIGGGPRARRTR
jgi:hypothetical protein